MNCSTPLLHSLSIFHRGLSFAIVARRMLPMGIITSTQAHRPFIMVRDRATTRRLLHHRYHMDTFPLLRMPIIAARSPINLRLCRYTLHLFSADRPLQVGLLILMHLTPTDTRSLRYQCLVSTVQAMFARARRNHLSSRRRQIAAARLISDSNTCKRSCIA